MINANGLATLLMNEDGDNATFYNYKPWINWYAMKIHYSQFVWYRRLFVVFSCYTYYSELRPMLKKQKK